MTKEEATIKDLTKQVARLKEVIDLHKRNESMMLKRIYDLETEITRIVGELDILIEESKQ